MVFPDMVLEGVMVGKQRRSFKVLSVDSKIDNLARFKPATTLIKVLDPGDDDPAAAGGSSSVVNGEAYGGELKITDAPGLGKQVAAINLFLRSFHGPFKLPPDAESCGLVIHGGRGTGKTFLLQRLAATNWGKAHWIRPSDKLSTIKEIFKQAHAERPSMVLIDALDELIVKDRSNRDAVIETLCDELDALSAAAVELNGLPKTVVVATCMDYMTDVPAKLQAESRFEENVTLPIPRAEQRLEILQFLDPPLRPEDKQAALNAISQKTHAYNPRDLRRLIRNAKKVFNKRVCESNLDEEGSRPEQWFLERRDMDRALTETRPTAMHDINLQPPTIHWQDVGGQESLKKVLTRMIKNIKVGAHPLFPNLIIVNPTTDTPPRTPPPTTAKPSSTRPRASSSTAPPAAPRPSRPRPSPPSPPSTSSPSRAPSCSTCTSASRSAPSACSSSARAPPPRPSSSSTRSTRSAGSAPVVVVVGTARRGARGA